jgi:peptidoglycan hydrolase-like protein with peptidoglycan-binding domain
LDADNNGRFDQKTETAVRKFQGDNDLAVDSVVGPRTWNGLVAAQ